MKAGEFPDGARTLAREDRHERAKHVAARSGALSHPPRRASSHRQQVVHLSDVRFRALPERLHRRHHALDLHAGVRSASPALRLDSGLARSAASAAASIRIRAPEPHLHRDEQAQAHATRRRKTGHRLGRSAHADHLRHAPARRHARARCALLPTTSASRNTRRSPTWPCSNTPSART